MTTVTIPTPAPAADGRKSPLDRFLEALAARGHGFTRTDGFTATFECPINDHSCDKGSAAVKPDGRLMLYCNACDAGFVEILKAVGLQPRDVPSSLAPATGLTSADSRRGPDGLATDEHIDRMNDLFWDFSDTLRRRPEMLAALATLFGASEAALADIGVGLRDDRRNRIPNADGEWVDRGPCWTFPEYDHRGAVVGFGTRFVDPAYGKGGIAGGLRGLTVPSSYDERIAASPTGTVYVVEGPSDVAALLTVGMLAVGRPSAAQGARLLARLFTSPEYPLAPGWAVIVMGENDKKATCHWPGRDGAMRVAADLRRGLRCDIKVGFPPAPHKDVRAWVNAIAGRRPATPAPTPKTGS